MLFPPIRSAFQTALSDDSGHHQIQLDVGERVNDLDAGGAVCLAQILVGDPVVGVGEGGQLLAGLPHPPGQITHVGRCLVGAHRDRADSIIFGWSHCAICSQFRDYSAADLALAERDRQAQSRHNRRVVLERSAALRAARDAAQHEPR